MTKVCSKCQNPGAFSKDSKSPDGLQSQCKDCKNKGNKAYYRTLAGKLSRQKAEKNRDPAKRRSKNLKSYYKNRVSSNFSRTMRKSLGQSKGGKRWQELVGYTLQDLKSHIESLFQNGMSWVNYGEWHIDHIRPVSSFKITSISCDDFRSCWSLQNLQPLWRLDNLKKSDRYDVPVV